MCAGPAHLALRTSRDKNCENNGTARSLDYWKVESCSIHSIEEATGLNQGWCVTPVRLGASLLPLEWMLVHRKVFRIPYQLAGSHLYTWVERDNVDETIECRDKASSHRSFDLWIVRSKVLRNDHYTAYIPHVDLFQAFR